jgi:hypothetical protein
MKIMMIEKVVHVPTRPRTKLARSKKIRRSYLASFIRSLGLTPEELQEKIRKLKYSRDYSFLFDDDHQQTEKIIFQPYFRLDKVEAFDHQYHHNKKKKKLKVGADHQVYVHRVKQKQ